MAQRITLNLTKGNIYQAVKSDTYITGLIDKSSDMVKNAALAYNEQAGDDAYHNTKLYRTLVAAVAKFEASLAEFLDTSITNPEIGDNLSSSSDAFTIVFTTGDRFVAAYTNTLSNLAQEYIINMMLYAWWQSIKPALAKDYFEFAQEALTYVRRTLAKKAPGAGTSDYTDVSGEVTPIDNQGGGGDTNVHTYSLEEISVASSGDGPRITGNAYCVPFTTLYNDGNIVGGTFDISGYEGAADVILISDDSVEYSANVPSGFPSTISSFPHTLTASEISALLEVAVEDDYDYYYYFAIMPTTATSAQLTFTPAS